MQQRIHGFWPGVCLVLLLLLPFISVALTSCVAQKEVIYVPLSEPRIQEYNEYCFPPRGDEVEGERKMLGFARDTAETGCI